MLFILTHRTGVVAEITRLKLTDEEDVAVRLCLVRRSSHTATDSHAQQAEGARYFACSKIKFTRCICRRFISRLGDAFT
jgi:hypothetical protein